MDITCLGQGKDFNTLSHDTLNQTKKIWASVAIAQWVTKLHPKDN